MDEAILSALRLAMDSRHQLHEQHLQLSIELYDSEKLQEQTIVNLSNEQYKVIAEAVDEKRRTLYECGVELRHAEEQIFALVNELLQT